MSLLTGSGWGALLMIAALAGWTALMLMLVYLLAKFTRPRRRA